VRRDPQLALDGGPIGTEIIFRFLEDALAQLSPEGLIAIEHAHDQSPAIADKAASLGYRDEADWYQSQLRDLAAIIALAYEADEKIRTFQADGARRAAGAVPQRSQKARRLGGGTGRPALACSSRLHPLPLPTCLDA
jgi:hypothetical protein